VLLPIAVAARSKASVCGRSLFGTAGSTTAGRTGVSLLWVFCAVRSGWSLVQRSHIDCDVSECDSETSIMRRPWPTGGYCSIEKKIKRCCVLWMLCSWLRHRCRLCAHVWVYVWVCNFSEDVTGDFQKSIRLSSVLFAGTYVTTLKEMGK